MVRVFLSEAAGRELVEILLNPIVLSHGFRLVAEVDARLSISLNIICLNLRITAPTACNTTSLVVLDLVTIYEWC